MGAGHRGRESATHPQTTTTPPYTRALLDNNMYDGVHIHLVMTRGIKVTAGTNTNAEKAEMISRSMEMLTEIIGPVPEASYVVIHDLDAGAWGYNGRTQKARADAKADAKAA